ADLENQLDDISGGRVAWQKVLEDFWRDFSTAVGGTKDLSISQVLTALDEDLGRHFFPDQGDGKDARLCPGCGAGRLSLKLGKFGAFIGCSSYPECRYTRPLAFENGNGDGAAGDLLAGPRPLGVDPENGRPVSLRRGPYGVYVQRGEAEDAEKPKRVALPKGMAPDAVDLAAALKLLTLPRDIGTHPEDGKAIIAGVGRFGPYIKHGDVYRSLQAGDDVLTIGLNRAVSLLAEPRQHGRGACWAITRATARPSTCSTAATVPMSAMAASTRRCRATSRPKRRPRRKRSSCSRRKPPRSRATAPPRSHGASASRAPPRRKRPRHKPRRKRPEKENRLVPRRAPGKNRKQVRRPKPRNNSTPNDRAERQ